MAPKRRLILERTADERVVEQFADLVRPRVDVLNSRNRKELIRIGADRIDLRAGTAPEIAVIADDAALALARLHDVVGENQRDLIHFRMAGRQAADDGVVGVEDRKS